MVSAFQDEVLGFGLPISPQKLEKVNRKRAEESLPPFSSSPGLRALEFGKHKEGYWNMEHMLKQLKDWIYSTEILYRASACAQLWLVLRSLSRQQCPKGLYPPIP